MSTHMVNGRGAASDVSGTVDAMALLTPRQAKLLLTLIEQGGNMKQASKAAGVAHSTAREWAQLPQFIEAYKQARQEAVRAAFTRLQMSADNAAAVLIEQMHAPMPLPARINAARLVLDFTLKIAEAQERVEEIAQLRQTLADIQAQQDAADRQQQIEMVR